jgi:hypothetical protein
LAAFSLLAWFYVWPWLRGVPRYEALQVLVLPHMFRFVGLSFLIPGVVSPDLPAAFAAPAAYGDIAAAILAMGSLVALQSRAAWAPGVVWLFNVWGTVDLVSAFYRGLTKLPDPGLLGAAYYIPAVIVPALLVTHALIFIVLISPAPAPLRAR